MTAYSSTCGECGQLCDWYEHPRGGDWAHRQASYDIDHDPRIDWQPMEHIDDNGEWVTM